jgi:hypothetical protein
MGKQKIILIAALLALAGSGTALFFSQRPAKINLTLDQTVGEVVAGETSKLLNNQGQVVLITQDTSADFNEALDAQAKSFQKALRTKRGLTMEAIERIQRPPTNMNRENGLSKGQFLKVVQDHPNAAAIVSLMGFPQLQAEDIALLNPGKCKYVAVFNSAVGIDLERLRAQQVMDLAVVARAEVVTPAGTAPRTARDWFDASYSMLKRD